MKIIIIQVNIFPNRFTSVIAATAEESEKNTIGTTIVKSRFRNTSPNGLKKEACSLKMMPENEPTIMEKIKNNRKEIAF